MNLSNLRLLFANYGCKRVYVKKLSANDNSKNQVYLGGSFEILNILPLSSITSESAGEWRRERFKASLNFFWIGNDGKLYPAPNSQLILYPKYPEVRFSGFLQRCENAPSELMTERLPGRLFFFSVTNSGGVIGYVAAPESEVSLEFNALKVTNSYGLFQILDLVSEENNKIKLISELNRIHQSGWIASKRLDRNGNILPCVSSNCGGYTLEAELGITPNGYSEPDYLGWEIKQYGVANINRLSSAVITLMTPEPTSGYYAEKGADAFIRKYGYYDLRGREDRMNFGGIHKIGSRHSRTKLVMDIIGFDRESDRIRNTEGRIVLLDLEGEVVAAWDFASLLLHWNKKHNQACYVPSQCEKHPSQQYRYGSKITLGEGTDFQLFLKEMTKGNIYYDPGIKMEKMSSRPIIKKRSQFRIKSQYLSALYKTSEIIDINDHSKR